MNTMVLLIGQNLNFAISSLDVADALQKAKGQKSGRFSRRRRQSET